MKKIKEIMRVNLFVNSINFKAGKVHLFSDFDGTYFPVKQSDVKNDINNQNLLDYAQKMDKLFKSTKDDLDFHITTGRDFTSYKEVSELLKSKKIPLTLPQSFITDNGWKEYCIKNDSEEFYHNGKFSYDENVFSARPHSGEKSKAYQPKALLNNTKTNSDLIIVAGNHGNDKEMLNPLKYLDLKKYEQKSQNKDFFKKDMNEKLLDLKAVYDGVNTEHINKLREEFKESGLLKEIEELPVYSIIVKNPKKNLTEDLKLLLETFHSTGKVIEVERGKLDDGIKTSVKKYAEFSSKFKAGMTGKFRKIVGIPNAFNKRWIVYSGIGIGVFAIGGFCWLNQTKTDKTKGKYLNNTNLFV